MLNCQYQVFVYQDNFHIIANDSLNAETYFLINTTTLKGYTDGLVQDCSGDTAVLH